MSLELVINGVVILIEGDARVVVTTPKKKKKVPAEEAEPPQIAEEGPKESSEEAPPQRKPGRAPLPRVGDPQDGKRMPYLTPARKKALGGRVKEARVALAMSQAQLNRECEFPQSMISLIETGRRYPNAQRRRALEHALGLPSGDLG